MHWMSFMGALQHWKIVGKLLKPCGMCQKTKFNFKNPSMVERKALDRIAAQFEKEISKAVDLVLALPDEDHKMDLLHVRYQPQYC